MLWFIFGVVVGVVLAGVVALVLLGKVLEDVRPRF
jgi:tetrahydromethanopterin S-methyltransferase subunit B